MALCVLSSALTPLLLMGLMLPLFVHSDAAVSARVKGDPAMSLHNLRDHADEKNRAAWRDNPSTRKKES
jgi:hypothetical protein